jgi:hypothetical protein
VPHVLGVGSVEPDGRVVEPEGELPSEQVAYLRRILVIHHDQRETGMCAVCGVPHCREWLAAYDQLATANLLMGEPSQWSGAELERKR